MILLYILCTSAVRKLLLAENGEVINELPHALNLRYGLECKIDMLNAIV